jgi:phosphate transport system permease protein
MSSPNISDKIFKAILFLFGGFIILLTVSILAVLLLNSYPAIQEYGFKFLVTNDWDPVNHSFGALAFLWGTLYSALISLIIAVPVGIGISIFITELAPKQFADSVAYVIDILASIPSIIFGMWGIFILAPVLESSLEPFLQATLGFLPIFKGTPIGMGMLLAGIILAIMILPTIVSISKEVLKQVPIAQKEAGYGLGLTQWEIIYRICLPYARIGIFGAVILAFARALGETMAVALVIGNSPQISLSVFDPASTIASVIANEFSEAVDTLHTSALIELALILFLVTFTLMGLARVFINMLEKR